MATAAGTAAFVHLALLVYAGVHGAPPAGAHAAPQARAADQPAASAPAAAALPSALAPDVHPLLVRACYPCHSDERADPWYAKLAPSSWSTRGARDVLNLSLWTTYDDERRARAAGAIAAVAQAATMPPADYTFFNHAARLSDGDRETLLRWASATRP
ncbi:MAG TPA: heme-binding domain-containing protein [Candidatus Binatia bacterium]